jgi:hypothetical protein
MRRGAGIDVGDLALIKIEFDPKPRIVRMQPMLVPALEINIVFCSPMLSFDAAATVHPEQAERVEGGRRGFAQDENIYINTRLFFRNGTRPCFIEGQRSKNCF